MKYLITERQLKLIKEDNIRKIDFVNFNNNWNVLQKFLERRGNPPYIITGDLDLKETDIETLGNLVGVEGGLDFNFNETIKDLGNLQSVGGDLNLIGTKIESLGNLQYVGGDLNLQSSKIKSLGNLQSVGGDLYVYFTNIRSLEKLESVGVDLLLTGTKIESLGNLQYVGADLVFRNTPLSKTTTEKEIRSQVEVGGNVKF